jgi:hypothetical protein
VPSCSSRQSPSKAFASRSGICTISERYLAPLSRDIHLFCAPLPLHAVERQRNGVNTLHAGPAQQGEPRAESSAPRNPQPQPSTLPEGFLDVPGLLARLPISERTLREEIKKRRIPAIRLPGSRRLLFDWPSVQRSLLRFQTGGVQ